MKWHDTRALCLLKIKTIHIFIVVVCTHWFKVASNVFLFLALLFSEFVSEPNERRANVTVEHFEHFVIV